MTGFHLKVKENEPYQVNLIAVILTVLLSCEYGDTFWVNHVFFITCHLYFIIYYKFILLLNIIEYTTFNNDYFNVISLLHFT